MLTDEARVEVCPEPISYALFFLGAVARFGERTALVLDAESRSYRALLDGALVRARQMQALGLQRGDRVGLLLPNSIAFVELFLAAALTGVIAVPMNTRLKAMETEHLIADSGLSVLFIAGEADSHTDFAALLRGIYPDLPQARDPWKLHVGGAPLLRQVVAIGGAPQPGFLAEAELQAKSAALPEFVPDLAIDAEEPQVLIYTSGTTARAKGCVLAHRCLPTTSRSTAARFALTEQACWWCPLPMFHIGGLLFMSVMFACGGTFVGMQHFTPDAAFDQIERHRPTVIYGLIPTITLALVHHPRFASVRMDQVGAVFSVAPADVQVAIQAAFPKALVMSAFGMSETTGIVAFAKPSDSYEQRMHTVGHLLPGWEVRIVDADTRRPVPTDTPGEITVRGPSLFSGYYGSPELTKTSHDAEGFFQTGDIGSIDADGLLRYRGRLKDQLKVGGENVSALEIESFLSTHPAVKLAQIVGVPDARYGEVPVAFVELIDGVGATEAELIGHCTGRIARYKIPTRVIIVTEWPMSATKIEKYKLRARLLETAGA